jgi:hypothetical protein
MVKVFISYAHGINNVYIPFAHKLDTTLMDQGLDTWIDLRNRQRPSKKLFLDAITNSDLVLILLSQDYVNSYYCNFELLTALKQNKPTLIVSFGTPNFKWHNSELKAIFDPKTISHKYKSFSPQAARAIAGHTLYQSQQVGS